REERPVLRPESGRRASRRGLQTVQLAAAATGQKEAEVVHDDQRHGQAQARQHVPPGDRLNRLGGATWFDLAVRQGRQLPPELTLGGGRGGRRGDRLGHRSQVSRSPAPGGWRTPGMESVRYRGILAQMFRYLTAFPWSWSMNGCGPDVSG